MRRAAGQLGIALCLFFAAGAARAASDDMGRISVLAGWRLTPNAYFADQAQLAGDPLRASSPGGPLLIGSFGYTVKDPLEVAIDLLVGGEQLSLAQGPLRSITYGGLLGARVEEPLWGDLSVELGAATGPLLVNVSGGPLTQPHEELAQGFAGQVGALWRLGPTWALSLEYRLVLVRGQVPGISSINGGGSWLAFGISYFVPIQTAPDPGF